MVRRPTLADVASATGVSTATVSYVLNDKPGQSIPEHTRERVRAAAAELGYVRSGAARALARGRSDLVLLVVPDVPVGPVLVGLLERLTTACSRAGLHLLAKLSFAGDDLGALCRELLPAAVIVLVDLDPERIDPIRELRIPVARWTVSHSSARDADGVHDVPVPTAAVGRAQAEAMVAAGRQRLAYALPADPRLTGLAEGRLSGVTAVCRELALPDPLILGSPSGAVSTAELRSCVEAGVTGVCAYNDDVALAVLTAARAAGIEVPARLAVIGVDDIPAGRLAQQELATISFDLDVICARLMLAVTKSLGSTLAGAPGPASELRLHPRASLGDGGG